MSGDFEDSRLPGDFIRQHPVRFYCQLQWKSVSECHNVRVLWMISALNLNRQSKKTRKLKKMRTDDEDLKRNFDRKDQED